MEVKQWTKEMAMIGAERNISKHTVDLPISGMCLFAYVHLCVYA